MSLSNKAVMITGASQGLGKALAEVLAERGARLALVARSAAALEEVAARARQAGAEAYALSFDVGDKDAVYPLAGAAHALLGEIDVLIHNAGALGPTPLRSLLDTECEDLSRVLDVNLMGPFRLTKAIAGGMALRGSGTLVFVSSDAAVEPYPAWGAYGVSKAALDHLARIWGAELAGSGLAVFSVDPGEMDTPMHRAALPDADPSTLANPATVAARIVQMLERAPQIANGARLIASSWTVSP
ncbi:MAG TPA: SDR family oxidoreductase [Polyangiaceae bacterium]|nr:SDR family oxidoreductase [Polyangiaceae bacterium]